MLETKSKEKGLQIPIIKFRHDMAKSLMETLPETGYCFKLNLSQSRNRSGVRVELGSADIEFDISILDRISKLLSYTPAKATPS